MANAKTNRSRTWLFSMSFLFLYSAFWMRSTSVILSRAMYAQMIQLETFSRLPPTTATKQNQHNRKPTPVAFLNNTQLSVKDGFSASWLQRKEDFLTMNLTRIKICEDAAFITYLSRRSVNGTHMQRMTQDWFDFSVEHLSKWWKMLQVPRDTGVPYLQLIKKLASYVENGKTVEEPETQFAETISVIAYMPTRGKGDADAANNMTVHTLAATLESLRRLGMGRAVVVGVEESQRSLVEETFEYTRQAVNLGSTQGSSTIGRMQVNFAVAPAEGLRTEALKSLKYNLPRGSLFGLRNAFSNSTAPDRAAWLGPDADRWKYVYLTEPDTLLHARLENLPQLFNEVNQGNVLLPHRLQPVPHESDLPGYSGFKGKSFLYLKAGDGFSEVKELDPSTHSCMDEMKGPNYKPGLPPMIESCGNHWYLCGFQSVTQKDEDPQARLRPYGLIRFSSGSGIVSIAGTNHGRRCFPKLRET